jgi:hypothetical protein
MSLPIQLTAQLALTESGVSVQLGASGVYVAIAGSKYAQQVMSVPTTSGGTAIPVSSLANVGYALFINLDPTNYCDILTAASGTAFARLLPGDVHLFRFTPAITAPALLAHTAACQVEMLLLEI